MSGVAHAIGKVFKGVVSIVKKVWKPLLIAAAIYFTGGLAATYFAGAGAAGAGVAAGAADATAGVLAADGAAFTGIAAGGAAAADAAVAGGAGMAAFGEAAAGAAGAAEAGGLASAVAGGAGDAAFAGNAAGAGAGAGSAAGAVGSAVNADGTTSLLGSSNVGGGYTPDPASWYGTNTQAGPPGLMGNASSPTGMAGPTTDGTGGASALTADNASSPWTNALSTAKKVMEIPGVTQGLFGMLNGYQQGQAMNAQLAYMDAHAPGQVAGGAKNAFSGFAPSGQNMNPQAGQVQNVGGKYSPYTPIAMPTPYLPGMGSSRSTSAFPGYGMPGYGVQPAQQPQDDQGLMDASAGGNQAFFG